MDPIESIKIAINTLDRVEVRGKANMDKLLGAIFTLEHVIEALNEPTEATEEQKGTAAPFTPSADRPEV